MPPQQPQLGSLAIQAPSLAPKTVHVSASTCHDLSLFKDLLKEYRRLDDSITMRLNRTTAQFRDRDRLGLVDQSMEGKRMALDAETEDPAAQRRIQGALYADEVKRNQVHNELVVEQIVRKRSLDAFRSRCKYFEPPLTDADARKWWDAARAGR
ncbi:hypothetical protein EVJ58_g4412 [Rhodofomes roseus]|uniref:Uncharacterized protein n=1 Tax=Rhodofomes roseus TaxID=34475 RepID=A0A4Y9YJ14_9APHY|nr:hypothetical protein EVJ58_g4412 [Rhodofomes roseus]